MLTLNKIITIAWHCQKVGSLKYVKNAGNAMGSSMNLA